MPLPVFLALFLPCAGLSLTFLIYVCLLWYTNAFNEYDDNEFQAAMKPGAKKGLSASELEKLPKLIGKDLVMGNECSICLDDIGQEELARSIPGCNHGFHLRCADTWLSTNPVCPVCRGKLYEFFDASATNPC
ncbi:hypothetical protein DCAR_0310743 [Daucus carota subsp. sativus]|uniref:RING-type domain-containing protein n=1 Tax=Daucus carota subsp. sativus TaxID=79200 RepID=A0AAF0WLU8_DAUCS|nr:hypothetical protein DCAR_0310743 [Daucus carota subsp. sativus]